MTELPTKENISQPKKIKNPLPSFALFIIIALSITAGFFVGSYRYQIVGIVGPVFGYKANSGNIDVSSLQETYSKLASNFDGKLDNQALIEGANHGMVAAAGDDYTVYMSPKEAAEFDASLSGDVGAGIGAEIGLKNDKITIIRALRDNPAEKAGLHAGDTVLSVNDQSTDGWTVEKAVGLIRGDDGTTVKISIQRESEIKDFVITRAIINNPSVESSIKDGIGVLRISRFDDKTGSLSRIAAQSFIKDGVRGVVLDLRGNGGGYVDAAKDVVGLWLNNQVVMTEKIGGALDSTLMTDSNAILNGLPTAVLVNGGSASASEIVAGALRDHNVAKLVGEKTFGKGSMQELLSLSSGARIKVTIAKWYTPNDVNLTKNGILPDLAADLNQSDIDKNIDPQMDAAKKIITP
ncbi:MAG: S41 family peptidase [Candidatus Saccharibacteria bacterium]